MSDDHFSGPVGKIKHVFVLVLENRSFDHMLGVSTGTVGRDGQIVLGVGADARTGAPTTVDGPTDQTNVHNGAVYSVRGGAPYILPVDPPHEFADVQLQLTSTGTVDRSGTYPPLTLGGYVDNYGNEAALEHNAEALADPGVVMSCFTAEQVPVSRK